MPEQILDWMQTQLRAALVAVQRDTTKAFYSSALYNLLLGCFGSTASLDSSPCGVWKGDAKSGQDIIRGEVMVDKRRLRLDRSPQDAKFWWSSSQAGSTYLHGFQWLRDLQATGDIAAQVRARQLVMGWLSGHSLWHEHSWSPDLLGQRVVSWLTTADFWLKSAPAKFRGCVLDSLTRQTRHLFLLGAAYRGHELGVWTVIRGLIYGGCYLQLAPRYRERALSLLEHALSQQLLGDGGHISRSPSLQLWVLKYLLEIQAGLQQAGYTPPDRLQRETGRMAEALQLLRHGDGGLALFNAAKREDPELIDQTLRQLDPIPTTPDELPDCGFQRLLAEKSLVIMDVGSGAYPGFERCAHAGGLSFEFSVAGQHLVVNCGSSAEPGLWQRLLATSAAHSTLILGDKNSSPILVPSRQKTTCKRIEDVEDEGLVEIQASHDGYHLRFGLIHHRWVGLYNSGLILQGQDWLVRQAPEESGSPGRTTAPRRFTIRFHLHPLVTVDPGDGKLISLRLPDGQLWWFQAPGYPVETQDSVYCDNGNQRTACEQLVISAAVEDQPIQWYFHQQASAQAMA